MKRRGIGCRFLSTEAAGDVAIRLFVRRLDAAASKQERDATLAEIRRVVMAAPASSREGMRGFLEDLRCHANLRPRCGPVRRWRRFGVRRSCARREAHWALERNRAVALDALTGDFEREEISRESLTLDAARAFGDAAGVTLDVAASFLWRLANKTRHP